CRSRRLSQRRGISIDEHIVIASFVINAHHIKIYVRVAGAKIPKCGAAPGRNFGTQMNVIVTGVIANATHPPGVTQGATMEFKLIKTACAVRCLQKTEVKGGAIGTNISIGINVTMRGEVTTC